MTASIPQISANMITPPQGPNIKVTVQIGELQCIFTGREDGYPAKVLSPLQRGIAKAMLQDAIRELGEAE